MYRLRMPLGIVGCINRYSILIVLKMYIGCWLGMNE